MIERAKIRSIIDRLKKNYRIDNFYCEELDKKFDSQTLIIGVVGKMKAGKSSLVNSVIFGDAILPSGVAPTTVTLTEIAYSDEEKAVVELLSRQDVEDLRTQASYNGNDPIQCLKAKAASQTLDSFASDYESYLDMPEQTIRIDELDEYINAKGKYSGLAKSVKIFRNNENLKGITIIDTPGFNDPIVSRVETTKKALNRCHVLLFVHNKDGYDESDLSLLVEQIEYAGISEIVDILNKIDMLDVPIDEWPDELDYFIQKRGEIKMPNNNIKSLIANSRATYVSSLMALCGLIPYDKMDDDMKHHFSSFEEDFEELCQGDTREQQQLAFVKCSNVNSVVAEINRLSKEGSLYLIEGPLKTLKGKLLSIKSIIESEIDSEKAALNALQVGIEASKKSLESFEEFMSTAMRSVRSSSLSLNLSNLVSSSIKESHDLRKSACSDEFSEERYPEPGIFTTGIKKDNIASYNTFVSGFENKLRDILENLKDLFSSECKNEVNSLITSLSTTSHIDKDRMEVLKKSLINALLTKINDAYVIVPSKRLSSVPDGKQKHWDKFRMHFAKTYDDAYLSNIGEEGIFSGLSQTAQNIDYVGVAIRELDKLKNDILDAMSKTPQQKKEDKERIENKIETLETELVAINSDIATIEEITKTVNSNA